MFQVAKVGALYVWGTLNDAYNLYQDCYQTRSSAMAAQRVFRNIRLSKEHFDAWDPKKKYSLKEDPQKKFLDNAVRFSWDLSDKAIVTAKLKNAMINQTSCLKLCNPNSFMKK